MDFRFVDNLTEIQIFQLLDLYKNEFWSKQRTYQDVVKMLNASDIIIGLVDDDEQLIGFTRVLTDFVYRATIYDVIIKSSHRNQGLGVKLIDSIIHHPRLNQVEQIALHCLPEMITFYEHFGFTSNIGSIKLMYRYKELHKDSLNDY
ncbi:GNAT family N-acetyltransferase [Fortiea sp. LEGE XX443]|uniref:GNAT family N-acetyltransferase n=1 Tax=Fortiea sp. LEGE XX443 TaxID=1828611 RepID=UPI00187F7C91|nr:GNAT family N-acetyltransferase [Fortiea sp. LEGE XX443]MBE9004920.1 GNAT family N-acetyltransferase [Fortiea sp. LEGE XX443]